MDKERAKAVTVTSVYTKEQNPALSDVINTGRIINFSCFYTRKSFNSIYKTPRSTDKYREDRHCIRGQGKIACFKNVQNHDLTVIIKEILDTHDMVLSWNIFGED